MLSLHEVQESAVRRIRAAFEAHLASGTTMREQFEAAKARTLARMQVELDAAHRIDWNRFTCGNPYPDMHADTILPDTTPNDATKEA